MTAQERMILFILASLNFTHILDFMIMMPLGNFLMPHFQISPQYFSVIVGSYPMTAFVSGLVAAFFVDSFDRKKVLLYAYIGFLIGTICCGIAPTAEILLLARILTGLFGGLIGAQVQSIVADVFSYEKRGTAMGYLMTSFSISSILGIPFSLYLAKYISWHAPFLFIGILGGLIVPLIIYYLPTMRGHLQSKENKVPALQVFNDMMHNNTQLLALLLSGILMLGHFLIIPFINPYMEFNLGFSKDQTPLIYVVGGSCALFASVIFGKMSDKYGKFRIFIFSAIASLIPIVLITNMPAIPLPFVLSVFGLFFIFTTGRNIPVQAMISTVVTPAHRGQFMSFNASFQQLFTGLASVVAGAVVIEGANHEIYNYNRLGYLSVGVIVVAMLLAYLLAKRQNLK